MYMNQTYNLLTIYWNGGGVLCSTLMWVIVCIANYLLMFMFMIFKATFNNISIIMAVNFIGEGNRSIRRKPPICHK